MASTSISNGTLVIFSGPSGVGKDTILAAWRAADPRVTRVVAYTTREPRQGEVSGIDYHFVSPEEFERLIEQDAFLEYKQVHGNFYGTPVREVDRLMGQGLIAVLKIDVQGAIAVMKLRPDAISIFVSPPDVAELERRIRARALDGEETIQRRLGNARLEMALADHYAHRVVNDDVQSVVKQLQSIVPAGVA